MSRLAAAFTGPQVRLHRSYGVIPLVAGVVSALALTGAAFYTVELAGCAEPGQYTRHDDHIELVGGCVDGDSLPAAKLPASGDNHAPINFRP